MTRREREELLEWLRRPHPPDEQIPPLWHKRVLHLFIALDQRITELEHQLLELREGATGL